LEFQRTHGLPPTGKPDDETIVGLIAALEALRTGTTSPETVATVQLPEHGTLNYFGNNWECERG
jgi:hypothetical protein